MENRTAFIIHKPLGVISATVDSQTTSIVTKIGDPLYLQPKGGEQRDTVYKLAEQAGFPTNYSLVGRLDAATSGIMVFTNNIKLDKAIRNPPVPGAETSEFKTKEYLLVVLGRRLFDLDTDESLQAFEDELGQPLSFHLHGRAFSTNAADVKILRRWQEPKLTLGQPFLGWCLEVRVRLQEGKHHQIRRIASRAGLTVISLTRTRIAGILCLDSVPEPGQCRWLTHEEIGALYEGLHIE